MENNNDETKVVMEGILQNISLDQSETAAHQTEKVNPFLSLLENKGIFHHLQSYLSKESLLNLRRLNLKLWNDFATNLIQLRLKGNIGVHPESQARHKKHEESKAEHFMRHSSLHLQNFIFDSIDFNIKQEGERSIIGSPLFTYSFFDHYSSQLKSLYLVKCNVSMKLFLRMISKCPCLEELQLLQCTSIPLFIVGFEILKIQKIMKKARETLSKLKHFTFQDSHPESLHKESSIDLILGQTNQLQHLNLLIFGPKPFPNQKFLNILQRNAATLASLQLNHFHFDVDSLEGFCSLTKLKQLVLFDAKIWPDHGQLFSKFLASQASSMEYLIFRQMCWPSRCFESISTLTRLKYVCFDYCNFFSGVLSGSPPESSFTKSTTQALHLHFDGDGRCIEEIIQFMKNMCCPNNIESLTLNNLDPSASDALLHIGNNFKQLKHLDVSKLRINTELDLSHLWKLPKLQVLIMSECTFDVFDVEIDFDFGDGNDNDDEDLELRPEMKMLDLSGTWANDELLRDQILPRFKNLEQLNLRDTEVTFTMLYEIAEALPNLKHLNVTQCPECRLSAGMYEEVVAKFNSVTLYAEIIQAGDQIEDYEDSTSIQENNNNSYFS